MVLKAHVTPAKALGVSDLSKEIRSLESIECGRDARRHFALADSYRNLNHGSFGTYPVEIRNVFRRLQELSEERPDAFIRYDYPRLLDQSRLAIAEYLHAPVEGCVFVSNATTGINTVMRNLVFNPGDVIIYFSTIYGACGKTVTYITETTPATSKQIEYTYPISDAELCSRFETAIEGIKANGKNPRIAIYDTIVSLPGVRMPFERLTELCRKHEILSCIDGAHGAGGIPLNLEKLDPDFFITNCHKWLHVPRGCALFYVAERNHSIMRSTLPTSHGFQPIEDGSLNTLRSPLPASSKSQFVANFEFVGTLDNSPVLCVPAALEWRKQLRWDGKTGEEAIMGYKKNLASEGGKLVASVLDTEVLDNEDGTLADCFFANVRLPLSFAEHASGDMDVAVSIAQWIAKVLLDEYDTFVAVLIHGGAFWVRLSAQIYLTVEDFEYGGNALKEICERVRKGEWKGERK